MHYAHLCFQAFQTSSLALATSVMVPQVARCAQDLAQYQAYAPFVDVVEWRLDALKSVPTLPQLIEMQGVLAHVFHGAPQIWTLRTALEGGAFTGSAKAYQAYIFTLLDVAPLDWIDLEWPRGRQLIHRATEAGIRVIASKHFVDHTPPNETLDALYDDMATSGASILKIAVYAHSLDDTYRFMAWMRQKYQSAQAHPHIGMVMGPYGVMSRVMADTFGSLLTFGASTQVSAPGQMPVTDMKAMLQTLSLASVGASDVNAEGFDDV